MTFVHRIDGAPGAGKTHTLLDIIDAEVSDNGVSLGAILYLNFTNAGREDSKAAMHQRFPDVDRDTLDAVVRTVHSAALHAVADVGRYDYDNDTIIQPTNDDEYYREFADRVGMNYGGQTLSDLAEDGELSGAGDTFFAINSWLAETYRTAKDARHAPTEFPWPSVHTFRRLQRQWEEFKQEHPDGPLWEHHDYVQDAIDANAFPTAEVVLIDEFQDLSPLQYKFYKEWRNSGQLDRAYIAGDPQQSIYSFRGATPYYFEETDADEETALNESYRCHGAIATAAQRLLNLSPSASSREFSSRFDGGSVSFVSGSERRLSAAIERATADDERVLLLTRTNAQWRKVAAFLREHGIPYRVLGTRGRSMWARQATVDVLTVLRTLPTAETFDPFAVNELVDVVPKSAERMQHVVLKDGDYTGESVRAAFGDYASPHDILEDVDVVPGVKTALEHALARETVPEPSQVRVGTIHASKGLEADTVFLFPSYSRTMLKEFHRVEQFEAEEYRVAYVAATRAKTDLRIVTDFFGHARTMPQFTHPSVREVAV